MGDQQEVVSVFPRKPDHKPLHLDFPSHPTSATPTETETALPPPSSHWYSLQPASLHLDL